MNPHDEDDFDEKVVKNSGVTQTAAVYWMKLSLNHFGLYLVQDMMDHIPAWTENYNILFIYTYHIYI